jgi:spermidine synthase
MLVWRRLQPWILIDQARTAGGGALELWRRGSDYSIRTSGQELMSSRMHGSEARLAELALGALGDRPRARVLIGGLGCGYTLAAALLALGPNARVVVDEISAAVIAWNRGELGMLAGRPLDDARVEVRTIDVIDDVKRASGEFDVILLDVDNGPSALSQARNAWLYDSAGLARLALALSAGGVLGVWSAGADAQFVRRLGAQRFNVEEHRVPASGTRGKRHTVWIAQRSG